MKQVAARCKTPAWPVVLVAILLALSPSGWAGLGLGEARVDSFLGQTLEARISLLQPSPSALDSLEASVASAEDHARLGVPTEALALGLSLVVDDSLDPPVLRLRSQRPVADPFVQVLVNVRWSSGRMLREYTMFLDPPAVPVAPTIRRREEPAPSIPTEPARPPEPAPSVVPETEPASPARPEPMPERYPAAAMVVQRGQTLWAIAADWRPDPELTMNQAMLAIFERNPDAFMNANVNRLRQGARLAMPEAAAARAIPASEAARRMQAQTDAWRAGRAAPPPPEIDEPAPALEPEPEAPAQAETEAAEAEPGDVAPMVEEEPAVTESAESEPGVDVESMPRLELTPPDEDIVAEAAALGAERERLAGRLQEIESAMAAEGLETATTEALAERIRQAIESADAGGLMVASEDLALFEQQLRQARQAREAEQIAAREAALADPPQAEPAPAEQPTEAPQTFLERWMWHLAAALAAVFVVLLVAMVLRRRRAALSAEQEPASEPPPVPTQPAPSPARPVAAPMPEPEPAWSEEEAAADPPKSDSGVESAALAGILGRSEEPEQKAPDEPVFDMEASEPDEEEALDLARLSNRLDPDERDETEPGPKAPQSSGLTLEDDDLNALFSEDEAGDSGAESERPVEDHEPLTLDFDLDGFDEKTDGQDALDATEADPDSASPSAAETESPTFSADENAGQNADENAGQNEEGLDDERSLDAFLESFEMEDSADDGAAPEGPEDSDGLEVSADEPSTPELDASLPAESTATDEVEEPAKAEEAALSDEDAEVKLDLARAYISMEDPDSARTLLEEILADGSDAQREQAQKLIDRLA